ncbi:hypothetical protein ACF0H5_024536 [Mactra antiquata]
MADLTSSIEISFNAYDERSPLLANSKSVNNEPAAIGQNKGFTLRRCMIYPMFVCYCLASGIFMYAVPQYTQYRMILKYEKKGPDPNMTVINVDNFTSHFLHANDNPCVVNKSAPKDPTFEHIQKETAMWSMYYTLASFIPAMISNIVWSSYSDVIGRKFSFYICSTGLTLRMALFILVIGLDLSLVYMVIGAVIDGCCGSFMVLYSALFSYLSDITLPGKNRSVAIVTVELVVGLSFTVSSFTSGYVLSGHRYLYPSIACLCFYVLGFILLRLFVPETNSEVSNSARSKNVLKALGESLKFYFCCGSERKRVKYIILMFGLIFVAIPAMGRHTMEMLYQLGEPFCWQSKKIGYFGSIKSVIATVVSMGGAYVFRRCLLDDTIAIIGILMNVGSYIVEGLAKTDLLLYIVPVFAALSNLPLPMIRSIFSSLTPQDKQGAMFACIGFVEGICTLIASVSNTTVYAATLSVMNGFVFILLAIFTFIGALFIMLYSCIRRIHRCEDDDDVVNEKDDRYDDE